MQPVLRRYNRFAAKPGGHWLFSRLVCFKAPYFASISPRIETLQPGHGVATLHHRRSVTNHIGGVHAIALCNLAEFVGGLTCEVSIPSSMRWIPKGMQVEYLKKAMGTMRAAATPTFEPAAAQSGYALPMQVVITDLQGEAVFRATINMWVSPKPARRPP